jgi:Tfp pilus assembly protein PilF
LFLALCRLTGEFWRSAMAALLFAVHPLRTEPVAWIAERKGVLSVFFGMMALWAYADYARTSRISRYLLATVALTLSLMAKQALVTFPCLLLLLDWWPLGRVHKISDWHKLVTEKLPFFGLAIVFSIVAYRFQAAGGALGDMEMFPLDIRVKNAVVSYVAYLFLSFYPVNLAVIYPHPTSVPLWQTVGSILLLFSVTFVAVALRRPSPYLLTGWLWYLGTLVPVIGVVQVSIQAYADRYCYFPQIGLLIAVTWGVADLTVRRPRLGLTLGTAAAVALSIGTHRQLGYWRNSVALWEHDIKVVGKFPRALQDLGEALVAEGRDEEAAETFTELIRLDARFGLAHASLGNVYFKKGNLQKAAEEFEKAATLEKNNSEVFCNYGAVELSRYRWQHAQLLFSRAIVLNRDSAAANRGLGVALSMLGQGQEATRHLEKALRLDPSDALAHVMLGKELERRGATDAAAEHYEQAVRLKPLRALYWVDLGRIRQRQGRNEEAARSLERAAELDPKLKTLETPGERPAQ